ncbi:MAG: cytidine deaminase [Bacteroidota bacterium]
MKKFEKKSIFYEYESPEKLSNSEKELIREAEKAAKDAYAPYSKFKVGAALLLENNEIIPANNQENAAYPSGLCAERIAVFYANSKYPEVAIKQLAITAYREDKLVDMPISPCGSCLQVLLETQRRYKTPIEIILSGKKKIYKTDNVEQFLPMNFDLDSLKGND